MTSEVHADLELAWVYPSTPVSACLTRARITGINPSPPILTMKQG